MKNLIILAFGILLFSSCNRVVYTHQDYLGKIQTKNDAIYTFGAPSNKSFEGELEIWTYNLGSGKSISINELRRKLSCNNFINLDKRNNDIEVSIASISKIKKHLNWFPETSIEEGLKKTLENDKNRLKKMNVLTISELKRIIKKFNN